MDLDAVGDHLTLSISTDGDGAAGESRMIAYRTRVMGGQMRLDRSKTGGTRMLVSVPLRDGPASSSKTH